MAVRDPIQVVLSMSEDERRAWLRAVAPDDAADLTSSSGGNSESQAATLLIRAIAVGEVRLRQWWRVLRREVAAGVVPGPFLCTIGIARILVWHETSQAYGEAVGRMALTVGASLIPGSVRPSILGGCFCLPVFAVCRRAQNRRRERTNFLRSAGSADLPERLGDQQFSGWVPQQWKFHLTRHDEDANVKVLRRVGGIETLVSQFACAV